jgi:hypothetical protein
MTKVTRRAVEYHFGCAEENQHCVFQKCWRMDVTDTTHLFVHHTLEGKVNRGSPQYYGWSTV